MEFIQIAYNNDAKKRKFVQVIYKIVSFFQHNFLPLIHLSLLDDKLNFPIIHKSIQIIYLNDICMHLFFYFKG